MHVVTAAEMREIDRSTIDEYGVPAAVLMERAGLAVAAKVREVIKGKKVLVLCGPGNNGGDGLAAARELHRCGFHAKAIVASRKENLSPECAAQWRAARAFGVAVEFRSSVNAADLHGALLIDALFGTGLTKPIAGDHAYLVEAVNESGMPVVSVDIPSGISADTGAVLGSAVRADHTVTFGLPKRGHYLHPGAGYTGLLSVADIGFPNKLLVSDNLSVILIDNETAAALVPQRSRRSSKGDYGHVLVVAGSRGKTGAALMTARACLRSGAGLVTLGVPESLMFSFQDRVTEEMTLSLDDTGDGGLSRDAIASVLEFAAKRADAIAVGPGLGVTADTEAFMRQLIQTAAVPLVIDADGLNALKGKTDVFSRAKAPVILTPHPGEMARLMQAQGMTIEAAEADRIETARSLSRETGTVVVLKGVPTVVSDPEGHAFLSTAGNPGMATAGSGDVLTGIIAGLVGQGLSPAAAAVLGVHLHGLAGDAAACEKGEHSLIASDIAEALPSAFAALKPNNRH